MDTLKQFRVIGPPGAGKTTYLSRQLAKASEVYGASALCVISLTNASAARVVEKATQDRLDLPEKNVGTLHSFAFRALGLSRERVADSKLDLWNEYVVAENTPSYRVTVGDNADDITRARGKSPGDSLFERCAVLRAQMVPTEAWPADIRHFYTTWQRFKGEAKFIDFTEMIEIALRDVDTCPGDPAALFVDEAQDFSRLAWMLARKWGEKCLRFITVGDPWQLLYGWAGSDVEAFYDPPLPESQVRVLDQSWRVPRAVLQAARNWIDQTPGRKPELYQPTNIDGVAERISGHLRYPEAWMPTIEKTIQAGKTVAVIASAGYLLNRTASELRERGIPYGNPYAPERGDFNPVHRAGCQTAASRFLSFLRCSDDVVPWTWYDLNAWCSILEKGILCRGAKARIEREADALPGASIAPTVDDIINTSELLEIMPREVWLKAITGDVDWFLSCLPSSKRESFRFPTNILKRRGPYALEETPRVILSTIHGIKGGECDVAIVAPDLSPAAMTEWDKTEGAGKEEVRRAFYVAMTRPREALYLTESATPMAVKF